MSKRKKRQQRLDRTVAIVQQKWGQEALRKGAGARRKPPHIKTGFAALDAALGCGGIPKGRITALSGASTSGKSTLAALVLAQAQGRGKSVAYIDTHHACDADYLARCGVDLARLLVVRPESGAQALEITRTLAGRNELAAILLDDWSAVQDLRGCESVLAQIAQRLSRSKIALLTLVEGKPLWQRLLGIPNTLDRFTALHLAVSRERWLMKGPDIRGYKAKVMIRKNKAGPENKTVPVEIAFNGTVRGNGL